LTVENNLIGQDIWFRKYEIRNKMSCNVVDEGVPSEFRATGWTMRRICVFVQALIGSVNTSAFGTRPVDSG